MNGEIETSEAQEPASGRVLIVGAGMAGSLLALALGRAGRDVVVFDPQRRPQPSFRVEKLNRPKIELLRRLGALSCFEQTCWPPGAYPDNERPALTDCGAPYEAWVAAVRAAWPDNVRFVETAVRRLETSEWLQEVETADGERVLGRLLVLATGQGEGQGLRDGLGVAARPISLDHSVCMGFSVALDRPPPAAVFQGAAGSGVGYVSLFPMPGELRVNVFSYRPLGDPWTRRMAKDPLGALAEVAPDAAAQLRGARLMRRVEARGVNLHRVEGHLQPGLVMIGDAFHAPCPASGTGMMRILNDVLLLDETYIPRWLATPGMHRSKIAAFYADPRKRRVDQASLRRSLNGRRSALGASAYWRLRRTLGRLRRAGGLAQAVSALLHPGPRALG